MLLEQLKTERPKYISKACKLLKTSRSTMRYQSIKNDATLMAQLTELATQHPREGFWKSYNRLRNQGEKINHKRVHRVYKQLGLSIRRKVKKRLPARVKERLEVPPHQTHTWSIDFTSDALEGGIKFRSFNVIDDFNREVLFIETDYSLKSSRVIWVLNHLIHRHGKPQRIRMDNGPEFIANLTKSWAKSQDIEMKYIQAGKPTQNAYIERFNRTFREGVLDAYLFDTLEEVRDVSEEFVHDYNHYRPHDALGGLSPKMYVRQQQASAKAAGLLLPRRQTSLNTNNL
jgi:putative transposase